MINIFDNKKLHFFLWILILLYTFWGFLNPEEFTFHKWGILNSENQYFILFVMLGISLARLIQLYIGMKKEA